MTVHMQKRSGCTWLCSNAHWSMLLSCLCAIRYSSACHDHAKLGHRSSALISGASLLHNAITFKMPPSTATWLPCGLQVVWGILRESEAPRQFIEGGEFYVLKTVAYVKKVGEACNCKLACMHSHVQSSLPV